MPAIFSDIPPIFNTILGREGAALSNATIDRGIEVICAFPLSSQYGIGSRVL